MEHLPSDRAQFLRALQDLGIHATQVQYGFELEPTASFNTIPGIYTITKTIPALNTSFRLFRVKYVSPTTHLYFTEKHFCGSKITEDLVQHLHTTNPTEVVEYIRAFHKRAALFLEKQEISHSEGVADALGAGGNNIYQIRTCA